MTGYDVAAFRARFPALDRGNAHFDGPGGSQVPAEVARAVADTLTTPIADRGRVTPAERFSDEVVLGARRAMADLLGADPRGVVLGRSMTALTVDLARAGRPLRGSIVGESSAGTDTGRAAGQSRRVVDVTGGAIVATVLAGTLLVGCGQGPDPAQGSAAGSASGSSSAAAAPGAAVPGAAPPSSGTPLPASVTRVLPTAYQRLAATADGLDPAAGYPRSVDRGSSTWTTKPVDDWTSGFFPGELWLARDLTGDPAWTARARRWTAPIASQVHRTDTHDLGFVVDDSFGEQLRATGAGADEVVTAARSLATRYSPTVHAIKSWDTDGDDDKRGSWRFPVIIDTTMNLELLDRAADLPGGDPAWKDIATQHALTASRTNMRPDGSVAHVAVFDPDTGAFLGRDTWQGAAPDSTWSRGQGWAIHGFAAQARAAKSPELRAAAVKAADWWLAHTAPGRRVPAWDFSRPTEERDTSAAAVAASGLLDLADQVGGPDGARYRQAAGETLDELASTDVAPDGPALLAHATGGKPQDSEVDVGLVYADYYFLEAARRWSEPART